MQHAGRGRNRPPNRRCCFATHCIEGLAQMVLSNPSGFTQVAEQGLELGIASPATIIQPTMGTNEDLPGQPGDPASPQTKSPGPTESEGIKRVTADIVG